jgi:maltose O-acetyltransferase
MPTEKEKMLAGELYDPLDPQLVIERNHVRDLTLLLSSATTAPTSGSAAAST